MGASFTPHSSTKFDRLENAILKWTRTTVTAIICLVSLVAILLLFNSIRLLFTSPDSSIDEDIRLAFIRPSLEDTLGDSSLGDSGASRSGQQGSSDDEDPYPEYRDHVEEIRTLFLPLYRAAGWSIDPDAPKRYTLGVIQELDEGLVRPDLDQAVGGMAEYVGEFVTFYTDALGVEPSTEQTPANPVSPAVLERINEALRQPLAAYLERYKLAVERRELRRGEEMERVVSEREAGREGLVQLGVLALAVFSGALLLLMFKVELSIRRYAERPVDNSGPSSKSMSEAGMLEE